MELKHTCCICGKEFEGYGNNPYPLMPANDTCCNECNELVIMTRQIYYPEGLDSKNVLFKSAPAADKLAEYKDIVNDIIAVSNRFGEFIKNQTESN